MCMSEFQTVVDKKFAEAQELYMTGKDALNTDHSPHMDLNYEVIGLDCEQGARFRYVISRPSIDTPSPILESGMFDCSEAMPITHLIVRIPRTLGDSRFMEDLPREAWSSLGNWIFINATYETGIEVESIHTPVKILDAVALGKLAVELSALRISERLQLK